MSRWGRGWEVSLNKEIDRQRRTNELAAEVLGRECGTMHALGTRADLCPKCQTAAESEKASRSS